MVHYCRRVELGKCDMYNIKSSNHKRISEDIEGENMVHLLLFMLGDGRGYRRRKYGITHLFSFQFYTVWHPSISKVL